MSVITARPLHSQRALLLGARSVIAQALAERLAATGVDLVLAARNSQELTPVATDLRLRHDVNIELFEFDMMDTSAHATLGQRVRQQIGDWQLAICVVGYLGDQEQARLDTDEMERTLTTNFTSVAICLGHLGSDLEVRGEGGIICISSVAGDRGRQSNYTYGAAKAGLTTFLAGLRNRLAATGVHVLTVKPGFVDTPMTEGLAGLFLVASPARVAADILRAWSRRRDVLYTPWFWRWIMLVIRTIPERIFKRLSL